MTPEEFVTGFIDYLHREAVTLRGYGAEGQAATCERNAADLGNQFRAWWLASLTIAEAARESGYAEESLRAMTREGKLTHQRTGESGPLTVRRCDLPVRPRSRPLTLAVTSRADRLLGPRETAA